MIVTLCSDFPFEINHPRPCLGLEDTKLDTALVVKWANTLASIAHKWPLLRLKWKKDQPSDRARVWLGLKYSIVNFRRALRIALHSTWIIYVKCCFQSISHYTVETMFDQHGYITRPALRMVGLETKEYYLLIPLTKVIGKSLSVMIKCLFVISCWPFNR